MNSPYRRIQLSWLDPTHVIQIGLQDIAAQDQVGELSLAYDTDEPCRRQFLDVMRQSGGAYRLATAHISTRHATIPRADLPENLVAARISQPFAIRRNWFSESTALFAMIISVHYSNTYRLRLSASFDAGLDLVSSWRIRIR